MVENIPQGGQIGFLAAADDHFHKKRNVKLLELNGTRRGGRTLTPSRELDFESSASTNSAIRAKIKS